MSKFYLTLIVCTVILASCSDKKDTTTNPEGKIGEWTVTINDTSLHPITGWDLILFRNGDTIDGTLCSEKVLGLVQGDSLVFTAGDSTSANPVTYRGRVIDKAISGRYTFQNGGQNSWKGIPEYTHQNYSRYYVFGGNVPLIFTDELGMHPERFGFQAMGSSKLTNTFMGDFPYYIIVVYPDNTAKIDAVGCDNDHFFETYFNAHAYDHQNIGMGPDNKYATVGKPGLQGESGPGGYVGIDASGVAHTSITIYICE